MSFSAQCVQQHLPELLTLSQFSQNIFCTCHHLGCKTTWINTTCEQDKYENASQSFVCLFLLIALELLVWFTTYVCLYSSIVRSAAHMSPQSAVPVHTTKHNLY